MTKVVNIHFLQPFGRWETSNGKVIKHDTAGIHDLVCEGFVPILHGDCVLDTEIGCTILSGDTIILVSILYIFVAFFAASGMHKLENLHNLSRGCITCGEVI